jgi:glycosyltransferase involved in cell wall biosynthesis
MTYSMISSLSNSSALLSEKVKGNLHVVIVARDAVGTGAGAVAVNTASKMAEQGHDVVLITDYSVPNLPPMVRAHVTRFGPQLHAWKSTNKLTARLRHSLQMLAFTIAASIAVRKLERHGYISVDHNIEAGGGDIIVLHNVFRAQFLSDSRAGIRKVPQFFNPVFGFRLIREWLALNSSRTYMAIGVSEHACEDARLHARPGIKFRTIHNGISLEYFRPVSEVERHAIRDDLGIKGQVFLILFIGHEYERKRLDLAIRALARCDSDCRLWVIGGRGSNEDVYKALASEAGVNERIHFWGTQCDVAKFLQAADCFLLPSDYETWGMVVLEAMACGIPPVMTKVGCATAVIRDGENGMIVEADAVQIANAVQRLKCDRQMWKKMSVAAREQAERHDWDGTTDEYLCAIREIHNLKGFTHGA